MNDIRFYFSLIIILFYLVSSIYLTKYSNKDNSKLFALLNSLAYILLPLAFLISWGFSYLIIIYILLCLLIIILLKNNKLAKYLIAFLWILMFIVHKYF